MRDRFARIRLPKLFRRHSSVDVPNTRNNLPNDNLSAFQLSSQSPISTQACPRKSSTVPEEVLETNNTQDSSPAQPSFPAEALRCAPQQSSQQLSCPAYKPVQQPIVSVEAPNHPPPRNSSYSSSSINQHIVFVDDLPTPASSLLAEGKIYSGFSYIPQAPSLPTPTSLHPKELPAETTVDYFTEVSYNPEPAMSRRKIWIKRPGASATLVQVSQDDVVDDVRDMVLRKYSNSLGRTFDAPDVVIRISPREQSQQVTERILSPEEPVCAILEAYFPGGQSVDEALIVEVPSRRTPRLSPRPADHMNGYFTEHNQRPGENEGDYFPPMPPVGSPRPLPTTIHYDSIRPMVNNFHPTHSIAIIENGHLPPLPSPRERRTARPRMGRQHTSSPTIIGGTAPRIRPRGMEVDLRNMSHPVATPPPMPTPPATGLENGTRAMSTKASTPPPDHTSPPRNTKTRRTRKTSVGSGHRPQPDGRKTSEKIQTYSFLEGVVPPINILIVEDNPINLRLLEAFAKRLKVRWRTAMNGRDAVVRWRTGGFHLVLMDIQLPIMSGLEATKEIRRLERVNGIGVFARSDEDDNNGSSSPIVNGNGKGKAVEGDPVPNDVPHSAQGDDKLGDGIFKSPVIIVALTASSLQSDRREALAAGCNDFLTKPVSFDWLERKVMEWGCMQALIDFDGWRKWKDLAADEDKERNKGKETKGKGKDASEKRKVTAGPVPVATVSATAKVGAN